MKVISHTSSKQEGILQVSKSRKLPILISLDEMENLLSYLGEFFIFDVSRPLSLEEAEISKGAFLKAYEPYIRAIERGEILDETPLRPYFSSIWTLDPEGVYALALPSGKYLIKSKIPSIQLQRHHFIYSGDFHSGVMGAESITWGIQFSYPHLFMDPKTKEIGKVEKNARFPNTDLFGLLAKWIRSHTRPTPFVVKGELSNQPMRLGKECFGFINNHPQLKKRGLNVQSTSNS